LTRPAGIQSIPHQLICCRAQQLRILRSLRGGCTLRWELLRGCQSGMRKERNPWCNGTGLLRLLGFSLPFCAAVVKNGRLGLWHSGKRAGVR
jgi:hypothetical protein